MINNRYSIRKKIGEGRSKVFLCTDYDVPGKEIALKVLSNEASKEEVLKFKDEFFTVKKLQHPNIIRVYEMGTVIKNNEEKFGITNGSKFITMEYFNGLEILDDEQIVNEKILREAIKQLCAVLYYLHQSNYIFYDLKPENILINKLNGEIRIKLIDFGFIHHTKKGGELTARGTAEYIAPEILRNESHNHRVDLYSLGMVLYRIVYNKFPFSTDDELEIYKAHVSKEFDFPDVNYSSNLIAVIKKLLNKNPGERYSTTLQVLADLKIPIDETLIKYFVPAKVFSGRKDVLNILRNYIGNDDYSEIFTIQGVSGSGKTTIINEINSIYGNTVLISNAKSGSSFGLLVNLLRDVLYNENVYEHLSGHIIEKVESLINGQTAGTIDELKQIFTNISLAAKFILLMDDFNAYNNFTLDVLNEIFPILQVNKIKVILTEDSDLDHESDKLSNVRALSLTPFTDVQLEEMLFRSFFDMFPVKRLKKLIFLYADLYPGSVGMFINDIILLNILKFLPEGAVLVEDEESIEVLKSSHEEIYKIRIDGLTKQELYTAMTLSSFELSIDKNILSNILSYKNLNISGTIQRLHEKGVLSQETADNELVFSSQGLKQFVYSKVPEKKSFHYEIAQNLTVQFPGFDRNELARHFELAEEYSQSYEVLLQELTEAEKIFAFSYQKRILQKILSLPLDKTLKDEIKYLLCKVHFKLSEFQQSLNFIEEIEEEKNTFKNLQELCSLKATCLIELGEIQKGVELLHELLNDHEGKIRKQKILVDIAYAEFDMNNYDSSRKRCMEVLEDETATNEEKGKCDNLLGFLDFYQNDFDSALVNFEQALNEYKKSQLLSKQAGIEVNLGNIYNVKGDSSKAEHYWNKALQTNLSIGNLDQEGNVLLSYGVYHYEHLNLDRAIEQYKRAYDIFSSLGIKNRQGMVLTNLGEVYLTACEFQNSLDSLEKAWSIFKRLSNSEEEAEVIFMIGKLYIELGWIEKLKKIIKNYKDLITNFSVSEKHSINVEYLSACLKLDTDRFEGLDELFIQIMKSYAELGERFNQVKTILKLVELYILTGDLILAADELGSEAVVEISEQNPLVKAEKYFLMGKIAKRGKVENLGTSLEYFNQSYEILENENITELTWKVLFELGNYFLERGNIGKTKEYFLYVKEVINHISGSIKYPNIKKIYFSKPERIKTINMLEEFLSDPLH